MKTPQKLGDWLLVKRYKDSYMLTSLTSNIVILPGDPETHTGAILIKDRDEYILDDTFEQILEVIVK